MTILRPYQTQFIAALRKALLQRGRVILQVPKGSGKL